MHILVVEDEKKTASFIRKALLAEGFAVDVVHDGDEVAHLVCTTSFDAIVMDIMLPKRDGVSALRQLRARKITTPVLLLSARGGVDERVEGLNAGADDYLPKPFVLAELIARIRALGRRSTAHLAAELSLANLLLNTSTRTAMRDSNAIELTSREYLLLEYLMRSSGRICSRMAILEQVWGYTFDPGTNIVDVYIKRVREKIDAGFAPKLLHSVRGVGYVMKIEA
jgi:DNA-binding response OmpR family regulator